MMPQNCATLSAPELLNYLLTYLYVEGQGPSALPHLDDHKVLRGACLPPAIAKEDYQGKRAQLRALENVRPAHEISADFIAAESALFALERQINPPITVDSLPNYAGFLLYQGDITKLKCDAIVNAANTSMLGCFIPGHHCIDNCIHSAAGVQLRQCCAKKMQALHRQAHVAEVIVTPGFNLPCTYVFHVTGPMVVGKLQPQDEAQLRACYEHLIATALELQVHTLAFCCLSTGVFAFPQDKAAQIAVDTCRKLQAHLQAQALTPIFCVFTAYQRALYVQALSQPD